MAAVATMVFIDSGRHQWRRWWDGGTMMQWHWRRWHLWPMVAAVMAVVIINCAVAVDATATIPSSALMVVAKTPSPLLPLTLAFIINDCYHHR
jgi:hypothetical protein